MRSRSKVTALAAAGVLMGIGAGLVLGQTAFNDVPDSDPRLEDINYAAAQGWFRGYPDGSFRPDRQITETQLAQVIRRARPGLTRGDAAVFVRGGMDRLQTTVTTTTTTAAAATTTTAPAVGPGGEDPAGPGGDGPVDPNPPVVIEPTTTTTAPAETTTTTTEAAAATTQPAGPTLVHGIDKGWVTNSNVRGDILWWEFRNWGSARRSAALPVHREVGGVSSRLYTIISDPEYCYGSWRTSSCDPWPTYAFVPHGDGEDVTVSFQNIECRVSNCTIMESESSAMPADLLNEMNANCASPPWHPPASRWSSCHTKTTTAAETTTTTTAPAETTTTTTAPSETTTTTTEAAAATTQPAGPTLVHGIDKGWVVNNSNTRGDILWWEFRNWGSARRSAALPVHREVGGVSSRLYTIISDPGYCYGSWRTSSCDPWPTYRFVPHGDGEDVTVSFQNIECRVSNCTIMESESSAMPADLLNEMNANCASPPWHPPASRWSSCHTRVSE